MAGLAMEKSKAEPADRNQAKAKLNRDAYVDSFPYVESYVDRYPYVDSNVNRYAYVEAQLYLLLVASRTEKSDEERSLEKSNQETSFNGKKICFQRIEFEQRLFKVEDLKKSMMLVSKTKTEKLQRKENGKMKQSTTIREELIAVSTAESSSAL
ncbi:hypothetical protein F511_39760 [Dorcoceras hygrometricum]|uniref:Uncharacterized protein n=1 Tax=Dorcoceras hygrometricum TaxID=472368 RepID=A0A2Z7CSC8_9LAMI|nr:hypothetical protein F511_39760 [Dorcoceras hygrometricum]